MKNNQFCQCKPEDQDVEEIDGYFFCVKCDKGLEQPEPIYDEEEVRK